MARPVRSRLRIQVPPEVRRCRGGLRLLLLVFSEGIISCLCPGNGSELAKDLAFEVFEFVKQDPNGRWDFHVAEEILGIAVRHRTISALGINCCR